MQFLLIRHGHISVAEPILSTPLSTLGQEQATLLAEYLVSKDVGYVLTSDMTRATDTASCCRDKLGSGASWIISSSLRELHPRLIRPADHKVWVGRSFRSLQSSPDALVSFISSWIIQTSKNQTVAIFTHGNVVRYLTAYLTGKNLVDVWKKKVHNASITTLNLDATGEVELTSFDNVAHLPESCISF